MKKLSLKQIATHEAAHTFAAWRLGFVLVGVTIQNGVMAMPKNAEIKTPFFSRHISPYKTQLFYDSYETIITAYPAIAEKILHGEISGATLNECADAADRMYQHKIDGAAFVAAAKKAKDKFAQNRARRGKMFFSAIEKKMLRAVPLDAKAKKAIRAVARELLRVQTLQGAEAARIFEKIYGGTPSHVLPVSEHYSGPEAKTAAGRLDFAYNHLWLILDELKWCADGSAILLRAREQLLETRLLIGAKIAQSTSFDTAVPGGR